MTSSNRRLLLIRNANPEIDPLLPVADWHLSEQGQQRAGRLAQTMEDFRPTRFCCSEDPKAHETGHILAAHFGRSVEIVADLHEHDRSDVIWIDDEDQFLQQIKRFFANPDQLVFGCETAAELEARYSSAVERLLAKYPDDNLALVTHATVMSLYIARRTNLNAAHLWQQIQQLGMPALIVLSLPDFRIEAIRGLQTRPTTALS